MLKIIFVCMGNICRSPSGEAVFRKIVQERNLESAFYIDSAGTSAYHVGETADRRMKKHASQRGFHLTSRSRRFTSQDIDEFDYIIAMDRENYEDILSLDKKGTRNGKIHMMTEYSTCCRGDDVPDPYYGGDNGFELVLDLLEESCLGLLESLIKKHGL